MFLKHNSYNFYQIACIKGEQRYRVNSKHRTEKLKVKNQKDIEIRKIKTKGAKNQKSR